MIRKLAALTASALMLTFALAGCGSDESAVTDDTDPTTAEAYDQAMEADITDTNDNPPE